MQRLPFHLTSHVRKRLQQRFPDISLENFLSALSRSIFTSTYHDGTRVLTVYATLLGGKRALALVDQEGNVITVGPAELEGYQNFNPDWNQLLSPQDALLHHPDLLPYEQRYSTLSYQPLKITCIAHNVAGHDPINLDSLLAYQAVYEATEGAMLPDIYHSCWALPVPIQVLWRNENGIPFYACSQLVCTETQSPSPDPEGTLYNEPVGARTEPKEVRLGYRFTQTHDLTLQTLRNQAAKKALIPPGRPLFTHSGVYRPQRFPISVHSGTHFEAYAIGNKEEVQRLLEPITFIGKHRARGYGRVQSWDVQPVEADLFSIFVDEHYRLRRYFPIAALPLLGPQVRVETTPVPYGFSPPYYTPAVQTACWPIGSPVLTPHMTMTTRREETPRTLLNELKGKLARLRPPR